MANVRTVGFSYVLSKFSLSWSRGHRPSHTRWER